MALDPATLQILAPVIGGSALVGTIGWVTTTWLRVKNGYPLESSWGKPLLPAHTNEMIERVKLLARENAQLNAELGSLKDRLQVLERIATDRGTRLAAEIDGLGPQPLN